MSTRARPVELEHECTRARARALENEHEVGRQPVRAVSKILNDMRNPPDIFLTCTWFCMGLDGSTCSECFPVIISQFSLLQPPEHVPRTSVRAHTCTLVFGWAPCVPRRQEHEKRPAATREKNADGQKKTLLYIVLPGSPSGCV